jgi:hypothetical protein
MSVLMVNVCDSAVVKSLVMNILVKPGEFWKIARLQGSEISTLKLASVTCESTVALRVIV